MDKEVSKETNRLRNKWFFESGEKTYTGIIADGDEIVFKNDYVLWLEEQVLKLDIFETIDVMFPANSLFHKSDQPLSEEVYMALEEMDIERCGEVSKYLNSISPQLTVCPCCGVDDFTHMESCKLQKRWNPED